MFVCLVIPLVFVAVVAQQIDFLAPRDDSEFTTDGQIAGELLFGFFGAISVPI
jgi:hypothetical protein